MALLVLLSGCQLSKQKSIPVRRVQSRLPLFAMVDVIRYIFPTCSVFYGTFDPKYGHFRRSTQGIACSNWNASGWIAMGQNYPPLLLLPGVYAKRVILVQ
jgi:hypothetical protein